MHVQTFVDAFFEYTHLLSKESLKFTPHTHGHTFQRKDELVAVVYDVYSLTPLTYAIEGFHMTSSLMNMKVC